MPFVEGESLRERLDREKQLSVDDAVVIATEVADALEAAHEQEVIHRDIKPANILLSRGRPLVADFGIALPVSVAGGGRLTETGLSLGTPHYMSPEQATGDQAVGPSTDVYALGSVLYEMLVGQPPYTGSTAQAILGKILSSRLVSATEERPAVPAHVDSAIKKALEKLPADRFKSARDFVRALADPGFRHGGAAAATTEAAHPTRTVAALATVSAVMTVLAVWGWMGTTSAPASARLSRLTATLPRSTDSRLSHSEHCPSPCRRTEQPSPMWESRASAPSSMSGSSTIMRASRCAARNAPGSPSSRRVVSGSGTSPPAHSTGCASRVAR